MKKNLFAISVSALILMGNMETIAQASYRPALQKGSVNLDGGFALSFGKDTNEYKSSFGSGKSEASFTSLTLSPKVNFFVTNGFALGIATDITSTSYKSKDTDSKASMTQFTLGPAIKYYTAGGFFLQGNVTFGKSNYVYDGEPDDNTKVSKWQLGAGYAIFLNDYVSIEPGMMYRSTQRKNNQDNFEITEKMGEFVLSVGFNIFIHKKSV